MDQKELKFREKRGMEAVRSKKEERDEAKRLHLSTARKKQK